MKSKLIKLKGKPFVRNVFIMATGTAAAQAITMALTPFIARIYGPEAIGLLGVFTAVVVIIAPIAALTYPVAIVLPKSNTEAKGLVRLSLYITVLVAILSTVFIMIFNNQIVNIFNIHNIAPFIYLLPLVILFSGFLQVIEQWLIRTKQFKETANATLLHALFLQGSKIGLGFLYPFASTLVILTIVAQFFKALVMTTLAKDPNSKYKNTYASLDEKKSVRKLAKMYKDFPIFRAPEVFLNAVSQGLPVMMLSVFFGPAAAGFYSIGRTVLSIPSQLIGKSVGDVFYPRISEAANNNENLTPLIKKATFALGMVGALPYGVIILLGPYLFSLIFGSEWVTAGEYARWIALWSFFGFMNRPSVRALPVLSAQSFHLKYTIFMLITRLVVLASGYYIFSSDIVSIAFFGVAGAILNIGLIYITIRLSEKFDKSRYWKK